MRRRVCVCVGGVKVVMGVDGICRVSFLLVYFITGVG